MVDWHRRYGSGPPNVTRARQTLAAIQGTHAMKDRRIPRGIQLQAGVHPGVANLTVDILDDADTSYMDERFFDDDGRIHLLPAQAWREVPHDHLRLWCHRHAIYGVPTVELVDFLRHEIDGDLAIEVGAGNGDLGWRLRIPATDSYSQTDIPWVAAYYRAVRQPATHPRPDTLQMTAQAAVRHYSPGVLIASWVTEFSSRPRPYTCAVGVKERELLGRVRKYVHVGNKLVHGHKSILTKAHRLVKGPWIVSRHRDQSANCIYIWERGK